jgi:alpha-galactosidase
MGKTAEGEGLRVVSAASPSDGATRLTVSLSASARIALEELYLTADCPLDQPDRIFLNGYQTWTESREYAPDERIPRLFSLAGPLLKPYGDYTLYKNPGRRGRPHSWTYTYVRRAADYTLIGSLSERSGYTVFEFDAGGGSLTIRKDCAGLAVQGEYRAFDLMLASGGEAEVFAAYFGALHLPPLKTGPLTGWTSWYNYYTGITERQVTENLEAFASRGVPIDVFQIDDGYQNAVGDWLNINGKFPRGMKAVADNIHARGYRAGLWLAPFVAEKKSLLIKEHPDWVLRDEHGRMVKAGWNPGWSGFFYTLDFYNPDVRAYLKQVFSAVLDEWRYDMVKLDFLYAVALRGRPEKTRGQIMCEAMEFLRECAGDKLILGCGVPLGPAFGTTDFCRIGSDVALKWEDPFLGRIRYRERVSTINSLTSTIGRRQLNGRTFQNDPDVFIVRSGNNQLTPAQRRTLFILNHIFGGLVFTSDNLNEYTPDELRQYLSLFPFRPKTIDRVDAAAPVTVVEFSAGDKSYVALANLTGQAQTTLIGKGQARLYLGGRFYERGDTLTVGPYDTAILCVAPTEDFAYAGGDGHMFPGQDVERIEVRGNEITVARSPQAHYQSMVYLTVPDGAATYLVNGKAVQSEQVDGQLVVRVELGG